MAGLTPEQVLSVLMSKKASLLVRAQSYCILNVQTTGLKGEVVQIGILDKDRHILLEENIMPTYHDIEPEAYRIHGLSHKALQNAPLFAEIQTEVKFLLDAKVVVCYGVNFVFQSIERSAPKVNWWTNNWVCLMTLFAPFGGQRINNQWKWIKLLDACKIAGVQARDPGSAIGNCLMAYDILEWMSKT